ncbi:MAG: hypothetical protein ACRDLS_06570 [Solirubrobacteraceae bacterium]
MRGVAAQVALERGAGGMKGVAVELDDHPLDAPHGVDLETLDPVIERGAGERDEEALGLGAGEGGPCDEGSDDSGSGSSRSAVDGGVEAPLADEPVDLRLLDRGRAGVQTGANRCSLLMLF